MEIIASGPPGFLAFHEPTGESVNSQPVCQFVPDSEEYDNYAPLMCERITGLAEFEDRQASDVIDDLLRLADRDRPGGAAPRPGRRAEVAGR
jgi:hypothetical protein